MWLVIFISILWFAVMRLFNVDIKNFYVHLKTIFLAIELSLRFGWLSESSIGTNF